jgi:SAM-dependent methyltransferase
VICAFALHHFREPVMVLENLYHAVRPGGWVYLVDFKRVPISRRSVGNAPP